jgi:hypothetical protein
MAYKQVVARAFTRNGFKVAMYLITDDAKFVKPWAKRGNLIIFSYCWSRPEEYEVYLDDFIRVLEGWPGYV